MDFKSRQSILEKVKETYQTSMKMTAIYFSIHLRRNTLHDDVVVILVHMNNFVTVSYDNFFSTSGNCLGILFSTVETCY